MTRPTIDPLVSFLSRPDSDADRSEEVAVFVVVAMMPPDPFALSVERPCSLFR